jgi:hypothetical protein
MLHGEALTFTVNTLPAGIIDPLPARHILVVEISSPIDQLRTLQKYTKNIQVCDVLSVAKDGQGAVWKDEISQWKEADDTWYTIIQGIEKSRDGGRSLRVSGFTNHQTPLAPK